MRRQSSFIPGTAATTDARPRDSALDQRHQRDGDRADGCLPGPVLRHRLPERVLAHLLPPVLCPAPARHAMRWGLYSCHRSIPLDPSLRRQRLWRTRVVSRLPPGCWPTRSRRFHTSHSRRLREAARQTPQLLRPPYGCRGRPGQPAGRARLRTGHRAEKPMTDPVPLRTKRSRQALL